jgi:hypothetical protein
MPDLAVPKSYDTYGHPNDAWTQNAAGFTASSSGTKAGTVVGGYTSDPTGTTQLAPPYCVSDAYGQFQITTAGTQASNHPLRTVYFQTPYPAVRPALATVTTTAGGATTGTFTVTMTLTSLQIKVKGTALTTATKYLVSYVIL